MGNLSKGVSSESANVGARWVERNMPFAAQSLKPRPALSNGFRSAGTAKAPTAATGASFNSSRRVRLLNLRCSIDAINTQELADAVLSTMLNEIRSHAEK